MSLEFFRAQMARLSGLRFVPAEYDTHWEGLRDLPDAVLEAAVTLAQRSQSDFPTPAEIRIYADEVAHRVRQVEPEEDRAVPFDVPRAIGTLPDGTPVRQMAEWRYYDEDCSDLGWRSSWCGTEANRRYPWMPVQACGRTQAHDAHEWAESCPCAATNPAIQRRHARAQKYAAERKAS